MAWLVRRLVRYLHEADRSALANGYQVRTSTFLNSDFDGRSPCCRAQQVSILLISGVNSKVLHIHEQFHKETLWNIDACSEFRPRAIAVKNQRFPIPTIHFSDEGTTSNYNSTKTFDTCRTAKSCKKPTPLT